MIADSDHALPEASVAQAIHQMAQFLRVVRYRRNIVGLVLAFPFLFWFISGLFFGSISGKDFTLDGTSYIFYIFIQALAYLFFALMLAVLFRRSMLAIVIFFLYGLIFEWLITALSTYQLKLAPASYFLPLQASDVLIPIPFGDKVFYPDTPGSSALVIAVIAYITLYIFFARKKFLIDDL